MAREKRKVDCAAFIAARTAMILAKAKIVIFLMHTNQIEDKIIKVEKIRQYNKRHGIPTRDTLPPDNRKLHITHHTSHIPSL